jgi:hypothetical protein
MSAKTVLRDSATCLVLRTVLLIVPLSAYSQVTLTGAIQFATSPTGASVENQAWNTQGGDGAWDLWLALNPNGSSPINGPSDSQAAISVPLEAGQAYTFYIFGAPASRSASAG